MSELSTYSTPTLLAMKGRLTNWIVYIAAADLLVVAVLVYLFANRPPARVMPLVPILTLPAIAILPFLRRVSAVKKELAKRHQAE